MNNQPKPWYYDPQFIVTVLLNLYVLIEYSMDKSIARSVVILYWWQSVVIGMGHFIQMITLKRILPFNVNGEMRTDSGVKWSMSIFFLVHFSIFHIGYLVFLMVMVKYPVAGVLLPGLTVAMAALLLSMVISLPGQIAYNRTRSMNIGTMFFSPYLRIIPMHVFILAGAWFNGGFDTFYLFMFLKFAADLITDWQYRRKWADWHPPIQG